jgi:hypothetical protein
MAGFRKPSNIMILISFLLVIISILLYLIFDIVLLLLLIPIGVLGFFRK